MVQWQTLIQCTRTDTVPYTYEAEVSSWDNELKSFLGLHENFKADLWIIWEKPVKASSRPASSKRYFPRRPHIKGCPKVSANNYGHYISALLEAYYLLENNVMVYIICRLNTSHHPENQDWKGHVLTPFYLLLLDQGKWSLPFLIWAAELSISWCLLWKTKEGINPPSSRKGSALGSCNSWWPPATWLFCPTIPVLSAVSQHPQWSERVLEQPKAGGFPCNVPMRICGSVPSLSEASV